MLFTVDVAFDGCCFILLTYGCCFTFEFVCMLTTCFKFVLGDLSLWLFVSIYLLYGLDFVICFFTWICVDFYGWCFDYADLLFDALVVLYC